MQLYHPNKKARVPLSLRTKYDPAWDTHPRNVYPPITVSTIIKGHEFFIAPEHVHLLTKYAWHVKGNVPYTNIALQLKPGFFTKQEDKNVKNRATKGSRGRVRRFKISWIYLVKGLFPDIPGRLVARDGTPVNNLHPDNYTLVPPGRVGNKDFEPRYHNVSFLFAQKKQGLKYVKVRPTEIYGPTYNKTLDDTNVPALSATPTLQEYKAYARSLEETVAQHSDKDEYTKHGTLGKLNFLETAGIRI